MNKSILLIGQPHSSKTVFLSQLYSRLQKKKSNLKLYKSVDDITPIAEAREALASGEEPQATPAEQSVKVLLPILYGDQRIDLRCPEYGGEQVVGIVEKRELNKDWVTSIAESDNWLLFIRLNGINRAMDISELSFSEIQQTQSTQQAPPIEYRISDQSFFLELLQILLHFKKNDYHLRNNKVKLTIVLTCWDELNTTEKPIDLLQKHLPLLHSFIQSNWARSHIKVLGLSAQGFSLDLEENKQKYLIDGPEKYGYLVYQDGGQTTDITELIEQSL